MISAPAQNPLLVPFPPVSYGKRKWSYTQVKGMM